MRTRILIAIGLVFGLTQSAFAHPGHLGHEFGDGFVHPLTGLDHLLAMVAVGLLAVRIGGRALWAMPAAFLASMLLGSGLAVAGIPLPAVEGVVAFSVLALGLLLAVPKSVPWSLGAACVILFAAFHGYAHASEMVAGGAFSNYAAGFLLATALLHFAGVMGGILLGRFFNSQSLRLTGGAISLAGIALLVSLI
jgi:urease accessory protein